jgi:4-hydroxyphenylacetate 3-monooxygenase/chlorophenol-4-monooxygenase component 2
MATDLGLEKLKEVLAGGTDPYLLNGDQYRESLRDGRRVVDHNGDFIDDVTTHPTLRHTVDRIAELHDKQFDPKTRDVMTFVDKETGKRKAIGWQVPTTKDHLHAKFKGVEETTRTTLGMYGRPPDYGAMMAIGFLATIDRIEKENKEFAQNIRDYAKFSSEHNIYSTDLIADAQSDRRIPPNEKPGRLRIIEDRPDGVVVYGSKVAGSIGNICHFFTLSTTLGKGMGEDAAIWAGVPVNSENLTLLMREPLVQGDANPEDHPLDVRGEEVDNYIMFDKVFIPREYLFSARNINLLGLYFESCAHALWHILARLAVRAQIFAGCAQAIVDILGTGANQGVRNSVTEIILYAAATRSFVLASIDEAVDWNGVMTPHPATVTAGRLYSIENYPRVQYLLKDLCGQGIVSRFPSAVWDHPEFAEKLEEFLPGTGVTAREKNRFFNFVYDLTCGSHANRVGQFENVNATPRYFISELVYQHYDRADWAKFCREQAGIPTESHT